MSFEQQSLLLAALAGAFLTALILSLLCAGRSRRAFDAGAAQSARQAQAEQLLLTERLDGHAREAMRFEQELRILRQDRDQLRLENRKLVEESASLRAGAAALDERLHALLAEVELLRTGTIEATRREAELQTRLSETERSFAGKEAFLDRAREHLTQEFQVLARQIFDDQGQRFASSNRDQIEGVLVPLREQLTEFKQRVEQVYVTESKDRASLMTELRNLQRASERINVEAENLARALKGDKKLQGNWGELVLERVLDASGLRRDHEYTLQASRRTESGDSRRPDVIIHLPDDKDIVVDAKVSLVSYERALATEVEAERERLMRQHVADLRNQVKRLAGQDYDRLRGVRSLDFVLLFVPIESAFTLAMQQDANLFTEAFDRRIVIVSPTTLMMTLRIIHNVWRYEKQSRNAQEIASRAGALYDKLRSAIDDMMRLGSTLRSLDQAYQDAMKKLATGRGNLVRQVEYLRELGAPVKRAFARDVLDEAGDGPNGGDTLVGDRTQSNGEGDSEFGAHRWKAVEDENGGDR